MISQNFSSKLTATKLIYGVNTAAEKQKPVGKAQVSDLNKHLLAEKVAFVASTKKKAYFTTTFSCRKISHKFPFIKITVTVIMIVIMLH